MSEPSELYTPAEVAEKFGVTEHYVKRHMAAWPRIEIGRQTRFLAEHIDAIAKRHELTPATPVASAGATTYNQRTRSNRGQKAS